MDKGAAVKGARGLTILSLPRAGTVGRLNNGVDFRGAHDGFGRPVGGRSVFSTSDIFFLRWIPPTPNLRFRESIAAKN